MVSQNPVAAEIPQPAAKDANKSNTHHFLQYAPSWIPLVSQTYIAAVFIDHVFRVSREARSRVKPSNFYRFKSVYDFSTMMIPGPLVPVF